MANIDLVGCPIRWIECQVARPWQRGIRCPRCDLDELVVTGSRLLSMSMSRMEGRGSLAKLGGNGTTTISTSCLSATRKRMRRSTETYRKWLQHLGDLGLVDAEAVGRCGVGQLLLLSSRRSWASASDSAAKLRLSTEGPVRSQALVASDEGLVRAHFVSFGSGSTLLHFLGTAGAPSLGGLAAVADHMVVLTEDRPFDWLFLATLEAKFRIFSHNQFLIDPFMEEGPR